MFFSGEYVHSIDSKNRLSIPAEFRQELDPATDGTRFYLVPGRPASTIWIYTERLFEAISRKLGSDLFRADEVLAYEQKFFPRCVRVEPDGQGRVLVPERMLRRAGLGRDVVVVGVRDHLEIRRRDEWEREDGEGPQDFGALHLKARQALQEQRERADSD